MTSLPDSTSPPFHALADRLGLGVAFEVVATGDGGRRFTFVSPGCADLIGVPPETLLADAEAFYGLLAPQDRQRLAAVEADSASTLEPYGLDVSLRRPNGGIRALRLTAAPRILADGTIAWDGLQIDETERRNAKRNAERDQWRVKMATEAAGLGFWESDPRTGQLFWTERTKALFGLPAGEAVTFEHYRRVVHPGDRPMVTAAYDAACAAPGGGDFSSEFRVTDPFGAVKWLLLNGRVLSEGGSPRLAVGTVFDVTARRGLEEQRSLVMAELSHRVKNALAYMMAMAQQIGRDAVSVEGYKAALLSRMQAMARSQELVTEADGRPLHLPTLLAQALEPFGADRFDLAEDLEGVKLTDGLTRGLALVLHEMGTNALKYGALANAQGRVSLSRDPGPEGFTAIVWREHGGPPVSPPEKPGFGSRLLHTALRQQGGRVEANFHPDGFVARVEFPTPA